MRISTIREIICTTYMSVNGTLLPFNTAQHLIQKIIIMLICQKCKSTYNIMAKFSVLYLCNVNLYLEILKTLCDREIFLYIILAKITDDFKMYTK